MQVRFPHPGDLFEDRYRIESVIGTGGFAKVYRATQEDLGRPVAIKVLSRGLDGEDSTRNAERAESASRRFRREARLVSQLRDPNTITIYDYGEARDGLLYIVLELVEGRSLKEILWDDGPLEPSRAVRVLRAVLSSLEEAHEVGILHRDIKPANIMLFTDPAGREGVKLLDFGIAKTRPSGDITTSSEVTRDGALVGTPRYMSPEQVRDQEMTPASDLFSLGLVAFEILIGEPANAGETPVTVIGRQLDQKPFVMPWREDIPLGLRRVVHKLLEKDSRDRFQSAAEVAAALNGWDDDLTDSTLDVELEPLPAEPEPEPPAEELGTAAPGRGVALVFVGIAVICLATVVILATRRGPVAEPDPAPRAAPVPAPIVVAVEPVAQPDPEPEAAEEEAEAEAEPEPAPAVEPRKRRAPKPKKKPEPEVEAAAEEQKPSFFSLDDAL